MPTSKKSPSRKSAGRTPAAVPTPDVRADLLKELAGVFPGAISEGRVDLDALKTILGDSTDDRPERYSFAWAGKRDAIRVLQAPSRSTLVPDPRASRRFEKTRHVFIEGDNLEVLKLLYKPYFGRVKMIYIDPPYNTGRDFIYPDNFTDPLDTYLRITGQHDADGNLLTSNPETSGRYHSAWLSMMYPRLFLARQLLRDDGIIFISIDDHEVYNLRLIMNEIFGEENFITSIIWQKVYAPKNTARHFSEDHDYILLYAKNAATWDPTLLPRSEEANARYSNPDDDPRGDWKSSDLSARNYYSKGTYEVTSPSGKRFSPPKGMYWRFSKERFDELNKDNRIWWGPSGENGPAIKRFLSEVKQGVVPQTLWLYSEVGHTQEAKKELLAAVHFEETDNVLDTVKPTRLIQRMLQIGTRPEEEDIVLDFFAGSGVTGHAVLKQNAADGGNRRFVLVQLPEPLPKPEKKLKTISDICQQRLTFAADQMGATLTGAAGADAGVRVYRLAPSHFRPWQPPAPGGDVSPEDYTKQMEMFLHPLRDGADAEAVAWEIALKEGFSASATVERRTFKKQTVWTFADPDHGQVIRICLDDTVTTNLLRDLGLRREDMFICRDAALNDELAANLALQCNLKTV